VNSSTSSSDPHRRYVQGIAALALIPLLALFALGVYLEPLWGDLTRVGGYSEKEFGWNKSQLEFPEPLASLGKYERYHDVVVLGDSYSTHRPNLQWQNYIVAATGWSVATLDSKQVALKQVLASQAFRETPPKLFILQTVERALPGRLPPRINDEQTCDAPSQSRQVAKSPLPPDSAWATRLMEVEKIGKHVKRGTAWSDVQLKYVLRYLAATLTRELAGDAYTTAVKVELSTRAPFSSANKEAMLVYTDDFRKVEWWSAMGLAEMNCRIERMRDQVEANGVTRFVLMVAPDKLTAYADFLADTQSRGISSLAQLAEQQPETLPRLDLALISRIRHGEQDVYLPDNTHWGSSGNRIAAEALLQFLTQRGWDPARAN